MAENRRKIKKFPFCLHLNEPAELSVCVYVCVCMCKRIIQLRKKETNEFKIYTQCTYMFPCEYVYIYLYIYIYPFFRTHAHYSCQ